MRSDKPDTAAFRASRISAIFSAAFSMGSEVGVCFVDISSLVLGLWFSGLGLSDVSSRFWVELTSPVETLRC